MTIELYCQHCGQHLQIPDQYAGQTGTCKNCGKKIAVPASAPESALEPAAQTNSAAIPYRWIGATVAVTTILALGIYLFVLRDASVPDVIVARSPEAPTTASGDAPTVHRTIEFPSDRVVGELRMRNVGAGGWGGGRGDARGLVTVPEGKEVGLAIWPRHAADLAFLKTLAPNDLGFLLLEHPSVSDLDLANIEHLTGLDFLLVEYNDVTDAGLRSLRRLVNLEFLGLGGTKTTDAGLATLAHLHRLEGLSVGGTRITDRGIRSLKSLPLESIMLSGMALTRPMVDVLKEIPGLTSLRIDSGRPPDANRIPGGDRPTSLDSILLLGELTQIETLTLNGALHDDSLIPALTQLTHLKNIAFEQTSITQVGKDELKRALPNCTITP